MAWHRIQLRHKGTDKPVGDPSWTPTVSDDELQQANHSLAEQQEPWYWAPLEAATPSPCSASTHPS